MDRSLGQNEDLLSVAAIYARDIDAFCKDVAAIIFPAAIQPLTDAVTSAVSIKLVALVGDMENKISARASGGNSHPVTWPLLARSGFLREPDLVDFMLARVSEDRLDIRLGTGGTNFTAALLDHADGNVAEAAQLLLAADSLHRRSRGNAFLMLPPELLHKLCWRVVAALEIIHGQRSPEAIKSARALIAGYDESYIAASAARKIVHFLGAGHRADLLAPEKSGVHLFVAKIAAETNIGHDHILRLVDCGSSAPLAILLAAVGMAKEDAIARLMLLRGPMMSPREAAIFDSGYGLIEGKIAVAEIASWSVVRSNYLAFGTI